MLYIIIMVINTNVFAIVILKIIEFMFLLFFYRPEYSFYCHPSQFKEETLGLCEKKGRSSQSILKEISSEYSLEGLMLKLKL